MAERDLLLRMSLTGAESVTAGLTAMSGKAGLAGLALTAIEGVRQFANFQAAMTRLKTQTRATDAEVRNATKGIMGMAVQVATSPNSLATAMYHLESANIRGKAALDALRIAAEGAKIGHANLTDTTNAMTAVVVAGYAKGKNAVQQMQHAMGSLNATVGAGDMTMQDLNDSLHNGILATFKTAGLQLNDFGAAMAVFGDNQIRGAQAATYLRMAVAAIIGPSKLGRKALADLGMAPLQLAHDLRKPDGLLVALTDYRNHLDRLHDPSQRAADTMTIFGKRQAGPILTLVNNLDRLRSKYDAVGKGAANFNQDWKDTTKTWSFLIDQGKALIDVVLLRIGGAIFGVVHAFQQGKWWAVALVSVLGGVAFAFIAIGTAMAGLAIVSTIAAMTNPITLTLVAAGALLALYAKFPGVRRVFQSMHAWMVSAAHATKAAVVDVINWFINRINWAIDRINGLILAYDSLPFVPHINTIGHIGAISTAKGKPAPTMDMPGGRTGRAAGPTNLPGQMNTRHGLEPYRPPTHLKTVPGGDGKWHPLDPTAVGHAVAHALHGTTVNLDGVAVGRMMVRQGKLDRARQ